MYVLTKNFRFESAHRLAKGYTGKCANIHGHSWNGEIAINWLGLQLGAYDMAIDFSKMGQWCKKIEETLDHKLLLWNKDDEIGQLCTTMKWEHVVFDDNPTCEVIARWLYNDAAMFFKDEKWVQVNYILIKETCTTSCKYFGK